MMNVKEDVIIPSFSRPPPEKTTLIFAFLRPFLRQDGLNYVAKTGAV
jgi:hypothetical protein